MTHKNIESVEEWNRAVPKGTKVIVMKDFTNMATITKTRSQAWLVGGSPGVLLDGISGSYSLTHVYQIEKGNP